MRPNKTSYGKRLCVYLRPEERQKLIEGQANSTCRSLSEYARTILAGKPVKVFYRNKSFDEFMGEAILLRKELREIREKMPLGGVNEQRLLMLMEQIKETINRIADICM